MSRGRSRFVGAGSRRNHQIVSGGGPVDPILATSPTIWLRSDSLTTSGSEVTSLLDKSGNGHNFTPLGTGATLVSSAHFGRDALDFNAATPNVYQPTSGSTSLGNPASGDMTVLHLVRPDTTSTMVMTKWAGADGWFNFVVAGPFLQVRADGTTAAITDSESMSIAAPRAVRHRHLFGVSETAFVDGTGTATSGASGPVSNTEIITLGARSDGTTQPYDGHWLETLLWLRALTAPELASITTAWNAYYTGLSLTSV